MSVTGYIFACGLWIGLTQLSAPLLAMEDRCFADWSTAAPIVKAEGLATVEQLTARAAHHLKGVILKTQLCEAGQHWQYRLVVREPGGHLRTLTVDARRPFGD